ncbi:uncharacterized protein A4U43_C10F2750 [Asparagus officinalis]|nr:uncharacterized protein A4U43_C10F2750 [Asparagus officinalis]
MKGILEELAPHLLTVACYDREVNCRRAASAAFQENVGRQGTFPHGIDIVNAADYFSLSSRANSYCNVAVFIAQSKEYLYPFVEELLCCKISHWDKSLRELAGKALSALAKYDLDYFAGYVLDKLVSCTLSLDLCTRHGATLAAGELVLTLHQCGFNFSTEKQKSLSGVVPAIEKARLYRGKGGEIMRAAVSRFIECLSLSEVSLSEKNKKSLLDTLNDNLKHPNAQIQSAAVEALKHFARVYLVSRDKVTNDIALKYLEFLDDPNVAARRGGALALGNLPYDFLCGRWMTVIKKLCSSCLVEGKPEDPDAEARVNAVRGLVLVCETLSGASNCRHHEDEISLYLLIKNEVMQTLFKSLDDYSVDNRGDVGSWVREAAMDGLERCIYILCRRDSAGSLKTPGVQHLVEITDKNSVASDVYPLVDKIIATSLVGGIAKQAVEKMDRLRDTAARTLQRILYNQHHSIPSIPHRDILQDIIPFDSNLKWGDPSVSYPRFVQLLHLSCYSRPVLSGLVISVGGLQESLRKASTAALLEYIQNSEGDTIENRNVQAYKLSTDLIWILQEYQKCDRIITPTFKTIEILLSKQVFLNMEGHMQSFGAALLNSLAIELRGSKDFTKLCTGLSVLGYVASFEEPINSRAVSQLLFFLAHRYPKIRRAAADQVYLVLLQNENLSSEDRIEKALEILSETCWEGAIEESKLGRSHLYETVGIEPDTMLKTKATAVSNSAKKSVTDDENASYSSLVESSGF